MYKLDLEKEEGPEIKLSACVGSQESKGITENNIHFCLIAALVVGAQTWITVILNGLPWKQTEIIL